MEFSTLIFVYFLRLKKKKKVQYYLVYKSLKSWAKNNLISSYGLLGPKEA